MSEKTIYDVERAIFEGFGTYKLTTEERVNEIMEATKKEYPIYKILTNLSTDLIIVSSKIRLRISGVRISSKNLWCPGVMVVPLARMGRAVVSERQGTGRLVDTGAGICNPCRHLWQ